MSLLSGRCAPFFSARHRGCVWQSSAPPVSQSGRASWLRGLQLPGGGTRTGGVGRAARWGWGGPRRARSPRRGLSCSLGEIKLAAVAPAGAPAAAKAAGGDLARGRGSAPGRPSPAPWPSGRRLLPGRRRGAAVESSRWRVFPLPGEGRGARGRAACGPRAS